MKKRGGIIAVVLCVAVLAAAIVGDFLFSRNNSTNFTAMNTVVSLDITGFDSSAAVKKIKEEILYLDEYLLSRTNEKSEIYAVNNGKTQITAELAKILFDLKRLEAATDGAFCIGLAQLSDLWGIGTENAAVPDEADISAAIRNSSAWQTDKQTVTLPGNIKLDLGAAGKGIACDYAFNTLSQLKCKQAVVAVGGSILLYADKPDTRFRVGVRDPLGSANEYCIILDAQPGCISTSGNYERFFEDENGNTWHHIFDPSTGYPAQSGLLSVTVAAQSGTVSDALSTACFVLGLERSLPLLEKYNADAIFITQDKEIITTYENAEEIITVTNDSYSLGEIK